MRFIFDGGTEQELWCNAIMSNTRHIYFAFSDFAHLLATDLASMMASSFDYIKSVKIDEKAPDGKPWGFVVVSEATIELLPCDLPLNVGDTISLRVSVVNNGPYRCLDYYIIDSIDTDRVSGGKTLHCSNPLGNLRKHTWSEVDITYPASLGDIVAAIQRVALPFGSLIGSDLGTTVYFDNLNISPDACLFDVYEDLCEFGGVMGVKWDIMSDPVPCYGYPTSYNSQHGYTSDAMLTMEHCFDIETSTDICQVTGISCVNALGDSVSAGDDSGYVLQFANNVFFDSLPTDTEKQNILRLLLDRASTIIYPYNMDWRGNPRLSIGEPIQISLDDGAPFTTLYMGGQITYDGGLREQSNWSAEQSIPTELVPTQTINDAIRTTSAKIDKQNQTIELVVSEIGTAKSPYATLKMRLDAIEQVVGDGNITFAQPDTPTGTAPRYIIAGDLWYDTDDKKWYRYNGTEWLPVQDGDIADAVERVSHVEQTVNGITSTVAEHTTHLGTIDSTLTTQQSRIEQLATAITSKVERSTFDDALNTITYNMSEIKQTADSVETEVSNARNEYSTLKQRIDAIDVTVAGGNKTYRQATQPVGEIKSGDLWFDTTNNVLKRYDGSQWIILKDGDIAQLTTAVSTLTVNLDAIQGTVSSHTQHLSTIDGSITSIDTALSTVRQTANAVSVEVGNACDQGSTLKQTLDAIRATVAGGNKTFRQATAPITDIIAGDLWYNTTDEHWYRYDGSQWVLVQDGDVATAITQSTEAIQTAQGFETRVTQVEQDVNTVEGRLSTAESSITQLATAITLRVEKDGVISSINQTPEEIKIESDKINLSGYVTFTGDDDGESVINGDNIITNNLTVNGNFIANGMDLKHIYSEDVHINTLLDLYGASITPVTASYTDTINYNPATQNVIPVGDDHLRISLTRHTGTYIMPTTDNYTATVVIKRHGYAGQTTATVPISMLQGTTGGGGSVVIPFTTPSAAYIDSVTYSKDSLTYHPLNYININKPIKVTSIKSPLNVQEIQSQDPFSHSTITYTDVMPQPRSNPGYPSSQIGSSTQKWANIWGTTIHADTIDIASFTPTYIGSASNFVDTIYANRIIPNNTLNIGTSNGDGTINVGQIQVNGYMVLKDNNDNLITMDADGWHRVIGSTRQSVSWDDFFNALGG